MTRNLPANTNHGALTPADSVPPYRLDEAAKLLAMIQTYDQTLSAATPQVIASWAAMLHATGVEFRWLEAGVVELYARGGEPPRNKLGEVIRVAQTLRAKEREALANARVIEAARARVPRETLPPGVQHTQGVYYRPESLAVACPDCGAAVGVQCVDSEGVSRRVAHGGRARLGARMALD